MENRKPVIPGLGLRSFKTAFSMAILAFGYVPLQRDPTLACIGALLGTGTDMEDSKMRAANRLIGTLIGGFMGLALSHLEHRIFPYGNGYMKGALIFVGTLLIVCISVNFKWPGAVIPGVAGLCIIIFKASGNNIEYVLGRFLDTIIGVTLAILVNKFFDRRTLERFFDPKCCNICDESTKPETESKDMVSEEDLGKDGR